MVISGALMSIYNGGTFFYGFTAFFNPIMNAFSWSRATISLAFTLQRMEGGILAPITGIIFDRVGPRNLMLFGAVIIGAGFLVMSRTDSLGVFYTSFAIVSLGFSACSGSIVVAAVANWFLRKRGLAMSLMLVGFGASGALVPLLVQLIEHFGWQTTLVMVAVGMWVIVAPLTLVMRHRPEDFGLLPDGDTLDTANGPGTLAATTLEEARLAETSARRRVRFVEVHFKTVEALRTRAFWLISIAIALQFIATSAIFVHLMPHIINVGIAPETAALAVTGMTLSSLIGRLTFGWLCDLFDKRYMLAAAFSLQTIGILIFANLSQAWQLIPFMLTFGPGYGGPVPVRPALTGDYFGRRSFGTIQGFVLLVSQTGGMLGPVLAGWLCDVQGSYRLAFLIFAACSVAAIPFILLARPPEPPPRPTRSTEAAR